MQEVWVLWSNLLRDEGLQPVMFVKEDQKMNIVDCTAFFQTSDGNVQMCNLGVKHAREGASIIATVNEAWMSVTRDAEELQQILNGYKKVADMSVKQELAIINVHYFRQAADVVCD